MLISFRNDWFDILAAQGTLKSLLQNHNRKSSVLWHSAFFMVQLSHPYMTTGKTIALIIHIFVGKVKSLLFNMLSSFVIAFLPRNKCLSNLIIYHTNYFVQIPSSPTSVFSFSKIAHLWNMSLLYTYMTLLLLRCCVRAKSLQSWLTLCDPMDCSPPGYRILHGILQARILEWVAVPSSRGSSWHRGQTHIYMSPALAGGFFLFVCFTTSATWEALVLR